METLFDAASTALAYLLDHPGLLVVSGVVAAAVGFIAYRKGA